MVTRIHLTTLALIGAAALATLNPEPAHAGATDRPTDVLFLVDTTDTFSTSEFKEIQAAIPNAVGQIDGRLRDVRYGLAQVRDYSDVYGGDSGFVWQVVDQIGPDRQRLFSDVSTLTRESDDPDESDEDELSALTHDRGDGPNAYARALHEATTGSVGWRSQAKKVVVAVTNTVPHDNDLNAGIPPSEHEVISNANTGVDPGRDGIVGTADDLDWQSVLSQMASQAIGLLAVSVGSVFCFHQHWDHWADATGGRGTHVGHGFGDEPLSETVAGTVLENTEGEGLADDFRPYLFFDFDEHWLPVDAERFLTQEPMEVCRGVGVLPCAVPDSVYMLAEDRFDREPAVLDQASGLRTEAKAHRPSRACPGNYQCSDQSQIYSQVIYDRQAQYTYINYWFFYTYNDVSEVTGGSSYDFLKDPVYHESDWEGMTVAIPMSEPNRFDYAAFASHKGVWRYLRDVLRCNGEHTAACGPTAQRVNTYVAAGTHASYPRRCSSSCHQESGFNLKFEAPFDGLLPWPRNGDPVALKRLPDPEESTWVDWRGNWNESDAPRVDSPAVDTGSRWRYFRPWEAPCTERWSGFSCGQASIASQHGSDCSSWFGPFVAAAACSASQVSQAIGAGRLGQPGSLQMQLTGAQLAAGTGVAQAVGRPLRRRERLVLSGSAPTDTTVLVAGQRGNSLVFGRFDDPGLANGGKATVRMVRKRRGATLRLRRPDGRVVVPSRVKFVSLRRPRRPRGLKAYVRRGRLVIRFRPTTRRTNVQVLDRRGKSLFQRTLTRSRYRRAAVIRPRPRGARKVIVTAIGANDVASRSVGTKIRRR